MPEIDPIYIGQDAVAELLTVTARQDRHRFTLVADENTYQALGERVEAALCARGDDVTALVLQGAEIIADERTLGQVLVGAPPVAHTFLAVGSGTVTDITRFVSHRTHNPFIALPTAPSVDGFTSIGAPLVLGGIKQTLICQPPLAVFADLPTLQAAPHRLIAAGFGDMVGKITSLADWKLGHLLWDEPYDEGIAQRARQGLDACLGAADDIARADETGIRRLIDGLFESGLVILAFGSSNPASGAEHHCSHYWEMMLLREGRPAILHGAKVGVATVFVAGLYERLRALSRAAVEDIVRAADLPDRAQQIAAIRAAYGPAADAVIAGQAAFLEMTAADFAHLKDRVLDSWDAVQEIAASVPPAAEVAALLVQVDAPTTGSQLGLSEDEMRRGLAYGHYLRSRCTIRKLFHLLGLPFTAA